MKIIKKKLLLPVLFLLFLANTSAQELITTTGEYSEKSNGSLTWTIGETVIESVSGTDLHLTQGFNQSKLIVTSLDEIPDFKINITVFPNPASNFLSVKINSDKKENFRLRLFDLTGKLILQKEAKKGKNILNMTSFPPAVYILKTDANNQIIKTCRIVKL